MCMYDNRTHVLTGLLILMTAVFPADAQQLGDPISESDIAPWDISISPDGRGLPSGTGTAVEGAAIYAEKCSACHGEAAKSGPGGSLAGGIGQLTRGEENRTLGSFWPYSTTIFDYVRRAMPYQNPGSLSDAEVYSVTAYLLHANGIISQHYVLEADSLPIIRMPNRDGFISDWPSARK
ncbi:cytochrome c [uncultured Roseobacter sp.]|uniref:c-type cytochrome n=1 Tax=uncultured Roseobacter sp. TaxID=114847 RepID=UPI0026303B37|nr:cytochrome c [uncultured Roseobacter sp.]